MARARKNFSSGQLQQIGGDISEATGFTVSQEVVFGMTTELPKIRPFPWGVVLLNVVFDLLTILSSIATVTGVGVSIPWILSAVVIIVNFSYFLGKASKVDRVIRRFVLKKMSLRILAFFVTDIIPFSNVLFPNFIIVIMVHYKETAIGKAIWDAVGSMAKEEVPVVIAKALREAKPQIIRYARNRITDRS